MTDIRIIKTKGQSALVEYTKSGKLERCTVPLDDIKDNTVSDYKLRMGIPYGVEWSKVVTLAATPEKLQQNLRQAGIWTAEDALNNAQIVLSAIQKTYQLDLGQLMMVAKQATKGGN